MAHPAQRFHLSRDSTPFTFMPLFKLFDDFERASNQGARPGFSQVTKSITPKFDVVETEDAYHVYADFPGTKDNLEIQFTDQQSISIRGRLGKLYENADKADKVDKTDKNDNADKANVKKNHQATVTDEDEDWEKADISEPTTATSAADAPAADTTAANTNTEAPTTPSPKKRYLIKERKFGSFHRSFTFPLPVDPEAVTASLSNGNLEITVPKNKKLQVRSIPIA